MFPRTELKYQIHPASMVLLRHRLSAVLKSDGNESAAFGYRIRSLYFDDPAESAFMDKINGVNERTKYRIRFYNGNLDYIRLEKKSKIGSKCFKESERISQAMAEAFVTTPQKITPETPLQAEMLHRIHREGFRPVIFVDYVRKAFCHPAGHVRITLDSELGAAPFRDSLTEDPFPMLPVFANQESVLEIKYDSIFPPYLSELFTDIPKIQCAVSKFCRCREMFL